MKSLRILLSGTVAMTMAAAPIAANANPYANVFMDLKAAGASSVSAWQKCAKGSNGCVLPLPGPKPVAKPQAPTPQPPAPTVEPVSTAEVVEEEGGFGFLPLLLGAAAILGGILIASGGDDDEPVSP